jgi:hypothetical protein
MEVLVMRQRVLILLALVAVIASAAPTVWAQYKPDPLTDPGLPPTHGTFSGFPWETIDMMSGNVVLTFPMIDLPGDNGLNLRVVATYSSKGPFRVRFGPRLVVPTVAWPDVPWTPFPSIQTMSGGQMPSFPVTDDRGNLFRTTNHLMVDRTVQADCQRGSVVYHSVRTVSSPDGVEYIFDTDGRMLEQRDVYGNRITASYDGAITTLRQYLNGGTKQRTVTIDEGGANGTTVTYDERHWTWTKDPTDGSPLTYQPPAGGAWTFARERNEIGIEPEPDGCIAGVYETMSVTTPQHGTVEYDFRRCVRGNRNKPNGFNGRAPCPATTITSA